MSISRTLDVKILKPGSEDLPGPSVAHIYVGQWSQVSDHPELRDLKVLGYNCMSYGELEGLVERLKQDLDSILKKGKRAFAKKNA